ncbi:MAG: ABC transporter substrate-binding protein [Cyanobacteriota bacterium]|jgi:peptide/nickel transport system substrate-binding protein
MLRRLSSLCNWRRFGLILALVWSLLFLPACGSSAPVSSADPDVITLGTVLKPRTLDPADTYDLAGLMVIYNLGETLYTYKLGTTELQPQLAADFPQLSADGLRYTIPLRTGVKFHDGAVFNAEAMAFSLRRFIENGGEPSFLLADTVAKIETTGEYELTLTLKKPFAAFPALLAFPGACAVSPQTYELGEGKFLPDQFAGTGPYQLANFSSDSLKLTPFPDYWGEKPKNQGVNLQLFPGNPANLFNAFRTGAVDVAYQSLVAQQVKTLQADAEQGRGQVISAPGLVINFLALNTQQPALKSPQVRQAIAALVDRDLLNERVMRGLAEPLYSLIPNSFSAYQPAFQTRYGAANAERAKQLLKESGFSTENPLTVQIWHSATSVPASMVAAILRALAKRDLEGLLEFQPNSIASAAYFKNVGKGLYESSLSNWYPDFLDPDNYIYPFLSCAQGSPETGCIEGGAQNQGSFYYNPQLLALIDRQRRELNPQRRDELLGVIQALVAETVPYIPLWQSKDFAFAQNHIQGAVINPSQTFPFWTMAARRD